MYFLARCLDGEVNDSNCLCTNNQWHCAKQHSSRLTRSTGIKNLNSNFITIKFCWSFVHLLDCFLQRAINLCINMSSLLLFNAKCYKALST